MNPIWPAASSEIILWAQLICVWLLATYAITVDWTRQLETTGSAFHEWVSLLAATGVAVAAGFGLPPLGTDPATRYALAGITGGAVFVTSLTRRVLLSRGRGGVAELELVANLAAIAGMGAAIGMGQIGASPPAAILRSGKAAAVLCVLAAIAFVFRGGTAIVRAVLNRTSAEPRGAIGQPASSGEPAIDVKEFNRGRSIGNLERVLMLMVIGLGSYEALGFLMAAKGLIRAREFEDRDFAEYFILGSLTSAAIAMIVGMTLRYAVPYLWRV